MWIEELKNGKFKYVERYDDPLTGKSRTVSITHTKNTASVVKQMPLLLQEKIDKKTKKSVSSITFQDLSNKWLAVYKQQVKVSSYTANKSVIKMICNELGSYRLNKINAHVINSFLLERLEDGNSYRYVSTMKSLITRILKFGLQYGYFKDQSIFQLITIPKINMPKKDNLKYLERHELKNILSQLTKEGYNQEVRLCELQTLTGVRFGELISLDYKKHINFKEKTILIERTYNQLTDSYGPPKSGESRTIHVTDQVLNIIKEQIQFKQLMVLQYNINRSNTLLFTSRTGKPYHISRMNRILKRVTLKSNKVLSTHIFRHTFISFMVEAGVDTKLIAEHVGHTNTKMVEEVYSHFTDLMDKRLQEAINRVEII